MKVIQRAGSPTTYLYMFTISAFIKVGTTTPIVTPIFKDYVDIARNMPTKYIYLQSAKTIVVRLNFTAAPPTAQTAAHV